jgi:M6 family metalloprotease-like protein
MIKRIICPLYLIVIAVFIFPGPQAMAGPASPDPVTLTNPDGTRFKAKIRGDEFQNWIETEEGYSIVRNPSNNTWEYAEKAPDGSLRNSGMKFKPGKIAPQKVLKGLRPDRNAEAEAERNRLLREIYLERISSAAPAGAESPAAPGVWPPVPVSGTKKVLIILINFANRDLVTTASGWSGKIFNTTAGVKSMANYYAANSYGLVTVSPASHTQSGNPAGIITVTVSDNHPNYGGSYVYGTETTILNHALAQAAPYIDFAGYDSNGNGVIEQSELSIYFIYAGYEASGSSKTPNIWAHAWSGTPGLTAGTKQVHNWAQNGEQNDNDVQHPMGVIAHEMGHSLCGLPDLYDTTYTNSGLGTFSLMAGGSWGADTVLSEDGGTTPVTLDAWSRHYLGWATPATLPANGSLSFPLPLSSRSSSIVLDPDVGTEYFLAENRYPTGWDKGMRTYMGSGWQGGLLILHVDNNIGTPGSNDINKHVYSHQGVMAEEANNGVGCSLVNGTACRGSAQILFYSGNNTAFTDATTPNSRYYGGTTSFFGLSSISVPGQTMSAVCSFVYPQFPSTFYSDGFEGSGWSTAAVSGSASWSMGNSGTHPSVTPHNGSQLAIFNSFTASSWSQARLYQVTGIAVPAIYDSVALSFWMYHDTVYSVDQIQVQVSTDGSSWNNLGDPMMRYDGTTGWSKSTLDLSAYKGQSDVRIGFLGTTSYSGNDIHLDDIAVSGYFANKALIDTTNYYMSLTGAYAAASTGNTIKARGVEFDEDLLCSQSKDIVLEAGYDSGYSVNSGYTVINGTLTIQSGSLTIENLNIR